MDMLIYAFALGGLGGLVVSGVALASIWRKGRHQTDVDELAIEVERLGKAYRRERMQRVRAGAGDLDEHLPAAVPLGPNHGQESKAELRARVFGGHRQPVTPPQIELPKRGTP